MGLNAPEMRSQSVYKAKNAIYSGGDMPNNYGEIIVDEAAFLASFGERQHQLARKYYLAKKLNEEINNRSEVARQVKQSNRTVLAWLAEEQIPSPIRSLEYLKSVGLMPLKLSNSPEFVLFTELTAFMFGDGHLVKNLGSFILYGQKTDLKEMSENIEKFYGIKPILNTISSGSKITKLIGDKETSKRVSGYCWNIQVGSSALARLLYLAGSPAGDKVANVTRVPGWVISSNKEIKRTFLSVLFGNELSCPRLRAKNAFSNANFGLHKLESKEQDLQIFMQQIRSLLREFGIYSSEICSEKSKTVRKDGSLSKKLYFSIDSASPNILKLFIELPFRYSEEKQARFSKAITQFLENSKVLKNEWLLYESAMKLHSEGLGITRIYKTLNVPKNYFYKINGWLYYAKTPLYYGQKEVFDGLI